MIEQAAIIGDGQMATVCAVMLAEKGIHVRMWSIFREQIEALKTTRENRRYLPGLKIPDRVSFTTDSQAVFRGADLIVSAVPCQYIRGVWQRLTGRYPAGVPITSVAKGIENQTLLRPTQVITDVVGNAPVVALSGPTIATELAHCLPATVVAASEDEALAQLVQEAFACPWFRVYTNTDLLGVELAGATKNIIALAAGIVDGLKAGDNAKAALVTRGLVEITRLGVAMGARRETFSGLAGLGDLVTTCVSPSGRNRWAGEQIGRGKNVEEIIAATPSVIEGIPTTRSVRELALRHDVEMPITEAVHGVLFEGKDVIATVGELMTRRLKGEV
ncbi:MAG TPA: NAD(P)H-dependent glycerol-3-phosphate dehydrogenase [Phycisphaerae bacterium]|nr:NAD(P)H-dependent glycerol-3-phosphate dehydrogenase [Phycisphaerae bacterium]